MGIKGHPHPKIEGVVSVFVMDRVQAPSLAKALPAGCRETYVKEVAD